MITIDNYTTNSGTMSGSTPVANVATTIANRVLIVATSLPGIGIAINSITDNLGGPNSYFQVAGAFSTVNGSDGEQFCSDIWYCPISTAGATQITLHLSGPPAVPGWTTVYSVGGLILRGSPEGSGSISTGLTSGPSITGPSIQTSAYSSFMIITGDASNGLSPQNLSSPWSGISDFSTNSVYLITSKPGVYQPVWATVGAPNNYCLSAASFQGANQICVPDMTPGTEISYKIS